MASQNTPTTLGGLEFNQIKDSLTEYLKTQSIFNGYNFEGSAIQTVIDLLAYNTFYYAYYANMINAEAFLDSAQKTSSIISLCKPLGYTVPDRKSAKSNVQLSGSDSTVLAGTLFLGSDSDGNQFSFFNLEDIDIVGGQSAPFDIVEGSLYNDIETLPSFDFTNQKISIATENFDISTIRVIVSETMPDGTIEKTKWTRLENIGYTSQINENIYFIERTTTGFSILFGIENSLGKQISTSNINSLKIRYLNSNGSSGNNISIFTSESGIVTTNTDSSGGSDAPNLDDIRFLAPKWFASQERAVTVNDYKALLLESGSFSNQNDFNVFGGQDLTPPKYGRVFVTSNKSPDDPEVLKIISFLKERSIITIFPEYVSSNDISTFVDFNFKLGNTTPNTASNKLKVANNLRTIFNNNYYKNKKYNVSFDSNEYIDYIKGENVSDPDVKNIIINSEDFRIYFKQQITQTSSVQDFLYNFNNEFYLPLGTYIDVSEIFQSDISPNNDCILKIYAATTQSKSNIQKLQLWSRNTNGVDTLVTEGNIGYYIVNKGVLSINSGVIKTGTSLTLNIDFLRKNVVFGLNNLTTLAVNNIVAI